MDFYRHNPNDPAWIARTSEFHGHLGPWLVVGAMIGRDAIQRLETPGQWKIHVVCWMPRDKQRTPFSCILDGLQVSSGATLGKQNIRFDFDEAVLSGGWPTVYVIRLKDANRPVAGLAYQACEELHRTLKTITPEELEEGSRKLAIRNIEEFFRIRSLSSEEIESALAGPSRSA